MRGIAHIHDENDKRLVPRNVKSSNIFLNSRQYGYVSDISLATLVTQFSQPITRTSGYWPQEGVNLVKWVHSVVQDEWAAEKIELLRHPDVEDQMVEMLEVGMACAARKPEQRPKL
ncbi:hypothetical protein Nepgr_010762 [Nepenthes gracilis]|uniref:Protein kinase domain-containing protein n=1 Tax=Nepenthes gracilis TaxID=150966 RepID=A0AAD3XLC7_NEPGR|nr:hypothetical protein Nepgr_010762 [Nepenthes gracilis]